MHSTTYPTPVWEPSVPVLDEDFDLDGVDSATPWEVHYDLPAILEVTELSM